MAILIGVCLFLACSSRIKVQTLVDFNEVPAEEKLPLVCQIIPGVPPINASPPLLFHCTDDFILYLILRSNNNRISPRRSRIISNTVRREKSCYELQNSFIRIT